MGRGTKLLLSTPLGRMFVWMMDMGEITTILSEAPMVFGGMVIAVDCCGRCV